MKNLRIIVNPYQSKFKKKFDIQWSNHSLQPESDLSFE